ncbi:hypothetical protein ACFV4K_22685 [Nocardia sp. NPDC059764]|uniref:hypothetical protein n=1 Tax=Nocardia sp. NPDC059764 TaxID=3346939 RepID=UPI00366180E2
MRNGSGDDWFIVFSGAGVYGRGFDHEAPDVPDVLQAVPRVFESYVTEPAFAAHDGAPRATVCFWREPADSEWGVAVSDRGGEGLFELLIEGTPQAYQRWAEDYYETTVGLSEIEHVYALRPLTPAVVARLNPEVELADLDADIADIGYPR